MFLEGILLSACAQGASAVERALTEDPPRDTGHPASLVEMTLPSVDGARMNAVFYLASGAAPHPTVLLLHGFPGNEQNLDLAQAIRRAGWNVLTLHYRGSWGSPGAFSFSHATEDADAALAFLRTPANDSKYDIDLHRIVVMGHSMGGFMALHVAKSHPEDFMGVGVISAWNIGGQMAGVKTDEDARKAQAHFQSELAPLAGCTAASLFVDAKAHQNAWNYVDYAPALKGVPVLVLEAKDGLETQNAAFAAAARKAGDSRVTERQFDTDHSFSDHRMALEREVLTWLLGLEPTH